MNAATTGGGSFSIATWNVNSLRVRSEQLMQWLADVRPDVVALQETKMQDPDFPHPDAPMTTVRRPCGNSIVRSLKSVWSLNDFVKASILTTAARWHSLSETSAGSPLH